MHKSDAVDFANYVVYEIVDKKVHYLCICKESKVAEVIAKTLAYLDVKGDTYYLTGINNPGDLIPGGGWYEAWHKDKESGKLKHTSLG